MAIPRQGLDEGCVGPGRARRPLWRRRLLLILAADLIGGGALALVPAATRPLQPGRWLDAEADRQIMADICLDEGAAGIAPAPGDDRRPARYRYAAGCWLRLSD